MISKAKARFLRALIEKAAISLADEDALKGAELFPAWRAETAYEAGDRARCGGTLYRCVQDHVSQAGWTPDATPALWREVAQPGEIPVWKRPTGAQDAYSKGDRVWYPEKNTTIYESLIDANVYSPEAWPAGWKRIG